MKKIKILVGCLLLVAGFACKEIYKPDIISSSDSFLVIEGLLDAGPGPTKIRLTRSFKLDDTAQLRGEPAAYVAVEGKDNITRELIAIGDGYYLSPGLNLTVNQEYRLKIVAGGKEYQSDYVIAKATPPIDSLSFRQNDKGVQIYADTHDGTNNTRYYKWEFDETWEINSYYTSSWKYDNGIVTPRTSADDVSTCWKYSTSSSILIGSTASLQSDIIYKAPLTFLGNGDEKLDVRYSMLLRQYALDKSGYEFYELMKKNTESLGTIFDAQPSEMKGNVHCITDPSEQVIGYVSAAVMQEKRFFINKSQLNRWIFYQNCPYSVIPNHPDSIKLAYDGGLSIFAGIYGASGNTIAQYNVASKPCVECTERGGSLVRPSYW